MLVELAGLDHHPLFGLNLDELKVLPGGERQQQCRDGERRREERAQGPSQPPSRAPPHRLRLVAGSSAQPSKKTRTPLTGIQTSAARITGKPHENAGPLGRGVQHSRQAEREPVR
jgi:hypothetical protein